MFCIILIQCVMMIGVTESWGNFFLSFHWTSCKKKTLAISRILIAVYETCLNVHSLLTIFYFTMIIFFWWGCLHTKYYSNDEISIWTTIVFPLIQLTKYTNNNWKQRKHFKTLLDIVSIGSASFRAGTKVAINFRRNIQYNKNHTYLFKWKCVHTNTYKYLIANVTFLL